ncbi:Lipid A biosynthesis palmitoleoyltransferase [Neolewinella maritima]|uniref:Lipid A biosynthesis palmitoleoyltransferase n=1 Tax=Neolewinella maritima TaxID=1383882 RepID=A0ABM9B3X1_9BACT|nr:lysophospholipid acyltransferase family protein [Neolewinella maritima]CAH1001870.1 Lipid A biosynthesis palmitoleoyltransferase [Neolewinella maritima]
MAYLVYYLILLPLSWLPLPVLYLLGDGFAWLNWQVIGYRKSIVLGNIRQSFPDYTDAEVQALGREYFARFFETIAESIKQFSMSEANSVRRCRIANADLVDHLRQEGRSFIAYGAHFSNWEMAGLSFPSQFPGFRVMGIYSPFKNATLDRLFTHNRSRTGVLLISRRKVKEYYATQTEPTVEFFVADQSPSNARWDLVHWTTFMGQTTSFLAGPERYAVRYDRPVYYMALRRERRGYYVATLIPITETPQDTEPGMITEAFARQLEREIHADPASWLWSHRRWKRGVADEAALLLQDRAYLPAQYER